MTRQAGRLKIDRRRAWTVVMVIGFEGCLAHRATLSDYPSSTTTSQRYMQSGLVLTAARTTFVQLAVFIVEQTPAVEQQHAPDLHNGLQ
jgi:hypothetical protein